MSEKHTARAVALMAGNAFLLNKMADATMPKLATQTPVSGGILSWGDVLMAMLALGGIVAAYFVLVFDAQSWKARIAECIAGAAFLFMAYLLLRIGYTGQ